MPRCPGEQRQTATDRATQQIHPLTSSWGGLLGPFLSRRPFARVCRLWLCSCTTAVLQVCLRFDPRRESCSLPNQPILWATFGRDGGVLGVHRRGVLANRTQAQGRAYEAEPAFRRAQEEGSASRSAHRECRDIVGTSRTRQFFAVFFPVLSRAAWLLAAHACTAVSAHSRAGLARILRLAWHQVLEYSPCYFGARLQRLQISMKTIAMDLQQFDKDYTCPTL